MICWKKEGGRGSKRQLSHASINLIEYLRCNLSFIPAMTMKSLFPLLEWVGSHFRPGIRARSATTGQYRAQVSQYTSESDSEERRLQSGTALFCKYEPVSLLATHFSISSAQQLTSLYQDVDVRPLLLLPLLDAKHFYRCFQALTTRYKVQGQWESLITKGRS